MLSLPLLLAFLPCLLLLRWLSKTDIVFIARRACRSLADALHVHHLYRVPRHTRDSQPNELYGHVETYLNSLPSLDDSDRPSLLSGPNPGDISLRLDPAHSVHDAFLGADLRWTSDPDATGFVLRIRRSDRKRVFRHYFQHILTVAREKSELKLHVCGGSEARGWRTAALDHPASFETVVVDAELKTRVKSDLELFLKSKQYYHRIGRVWNRSYLLSGSSDKAGFVAAMARFLSYDVYVVDSDHKSRLLQTTPRSIIVVEGNPGVPMDGILSYCGEERIVVFATEGGDDRGGDGHVDVHVRFPLCESFAAFKGLASSYLGLKEHKLFPQVEEIFQTGGARLSPAEIGEIMMSNRTSPSRALKTVISALQTSKLPPVAPRLSPSGSGRSGDGAASVFCRESVHTVREFRKLYGLLRLGSRRKEEAAVDCGDVDKEASKHD